MEVERTLQRSAQARRTSPMGVRGQVYEGRPKKVLLRVCKPRDGLIYTSFECFLYFRMRQVWPASETMCGALPTIQRCRVEWEQRPEKYLCESPFGACCLFCLRVWCELFRVSCRTGHPLEKVPGVIIFEIYGIPSAHTHSDGTLIASTSRSPIAAGWQITTLSTRPVDAIRTHEPPP